MSIPGRYYYTISLKDHGLEASMLTDTITSHVRHFHEDGIQFWHGSHY